MQNAQASKGFPGIPGLPFAGFWAFLGYRINLTRKNSTKNGRGASAAFGACWKTVLFPGPAGLAGLLQQQLLLRINVYPSVVVVVEVVLPVCSLASSPEIALHSGVATRFQ